MPLLVVFGYGPGTSHATAERFGREGYSVALVGRSGERLTAGVARLASQGIEAAAYQADASDPVAIRSAIARIRDGQGSITSLLWTAFRNGDVRDVLEARPENVVSVFAVGVTGLLTAVQEVRDDLVTNADAAVLVINGAVGEPTTPMDAASAYLGIDGTALENAAKSKLVGLLSERLRAFGVYVGEVTIVGSVAGTATASPTAIETTLIADTLWGLTRSRDVTRVRLVEAQ